ncbi:MAG: hypothetical protein LBC96_09290 [Lachnospiraceae bacterium]|nr:hypothetical protein [Lachnospiraceae bacterium]
MYAKLKEHRLMIIFSAIIFLMVLLYYSTVNPVVLSISNTDDWTYFGTFRSHPYPRSGWNVTRILPETLYPLTGLFSAFVIYPLTGDYLMSASIALAIVMAIALTALYIAIYGLFRALCVNHRLCALVALMAMLLFAIIFKSASAPAGNVHMFFSGAYNLYFFYVLPNILNSMVVLLLMRITIKTGALSLLTYIEMPTKNGGGGRKTRYRQQ